MANQSSKEMASSNANLGNIEMAKNYLLWKW